MLPTETPMTFFLINGKSNSKICMELQGNPSNQNVLEKEKQS